MPILLLALAGCGSAPRSGPADATAWVEVAPAREPSASELQKALAQLEVDAPAAAARLALANAVTAAPRMVAALEKETDPKSLVELLMALAMLETHEAIPRARALLEHAVPDVRDAAAVVLVVLGDRASLPRILALVEARQLSEDSDCLRVLADAGIPEAEGAFRRAASAPDLGERDTGLRGLARIDPERVAPELRRALADPELRDRAALYLAWVQDRAAYEVLRQQSVCNPPLNAWSDPETWRRLDRLRLHLRDFGNHTVGEVVAAISRHVPIEISSEVPAGFRDSKFSAHRLLVLGFTPTALRFLLGLPHRWLIPGGAEVLWIAERGKVRIVTWKEAERFWSGFTLPASSR